MCLSCHFLYIGIADCLASSISAIFRTRTSSSISKDDTEMREVLNNQDNVTTFDCHWKGMESWGGNNKSFGADTPAHIFIKVFGYSGRHGDRKGVKT